LNSDLQDRLAAAQAYRSEVAQALADQAERVRQLAERAHAFESEFRARAQARTEPSRDTE
jgi:DNA-binding ferritin-like protein